MTELLGLDVEPKDLTVLQVCLRTLIVFTTTLVLVRLAHKRFMARMSAFDVVLGLIMASLLARAINGSAPLFPTLAGGLVLVLLHRSLSALAFHWSTIGTLVKGQSDLLVEDGKVFSAALRRHKVSHADLLEEARLNGKVDKIEEIRVATMERSGQISVLKSGKSS